MICRTNICSCKNDDSDSVVDEPLNRNVDINDENNNDEDVQIENEHARELQSNNTPDNILWTVRGRHVDPRFIKYAVQSIMGFSIIIFCCAKLITIDPGDCSQSDSRSLYASMLSGTLGYFLPNPSMTT